MTCTVGIDPGLKGAIGFLRNGEYVHVESMPTVLKSKTTGKLEVDPRRLRGILRDNVPPNANPIVFLERVHAMPGQGVTSMFSLGDSFGCARAVVASTPWELVCESPQMWKKHFGLGSDKEECRQYAMALFPDAPIQLKKWVDRAEALLMARYVWETKCQ